MLALFAHGQSAKTLCLAFSIRAQKPFWGCYIRTFLLM